LSKSVTCAIVYKSAISSLESVPATAGATLIASLRALGADISQVLAQAGLSYLGPALDSEIGAKLSHDEFARLGHTAVPLIEELTCQREALRPMSRNAFRLVCIAMLGCPDLRTAVEVTSFAYGELHHYCGGLKLSETGDEATLSLDLGRKINDGANLLVTLYALSTYHHLFGWLVNQDIDAIEVKLAFPASACQPALNMFLPVEPDFDRSESALRFNSACLSLPIARRYAELELLLGTFPFIMVPPVYNNYNLGERIRSITMAALSGGRNLPDGRMIAQILRLSESTVRRRLAREQLSIVDIRNECRRRVATRLLIETPMTVKEVAARVRFEDVASFSRAFRLWTGISPRAFRDLGQSGSHRALAKIRAQ